jgi:uncharacterized protein (DUF1499 family)
MMETSGVLYHVTINFTREVCMKFELIVSLIFMVAVFAACSGKVPSNLGVTGGKLNPCPASPNCVSSQASDEAHRIDPLSYSGSLAGAKDKLEKVITSMKRARIVTTRDNYIHAEYTSAMFRFVDDVEFYFDDAVKTIHVRSASRLGYSDMSVNRKRVESIRELFNK